MSVVLLLVGVLLLLLVAIIPTVLFFTALRKDSPFQWIIRRLFKNEEGTKDFKSSGNSLKEEIAWCEQNGEHCWITSEDGLKLHALYYPNEQSHGKYVITCHGYRAKAQWNGSYLHKMYGMGYSILAPDARAHGESEGTYIGMGWLERRDIPKWAQYLIEKDPEARIALYGISMGGATVMMTVGEPLPSNVVAAIEDCGYSSVWEEFSMQIKALHLPVFPVMYVANVMVRAFAHYDLKEASSIEQLKKCKIPLLLMHGEADAFVPFRMFKEVCDAVPTEKQCLSFPGAGHAGSFSTNPQRYWTAIEDFLAAKL